MDLAGLQQADPDALQECAAAYDRLAEAFRRHVEEWQSTVVARTDDSGWLGTAADACRSALARTDARLTSARTELLLIGATLRAGAEAVRLARGQLLAALAEATAAGLAVDADGRVTRPTRTEGDRHDPDARNCPPQARQLAERIGSALADAATADQALADRLLDFARCATDGSGLGYRGFAPDPLAPTITVPDLLGPALPAPGAPPQAVNAWWRSLPVAEQQRLITAHPELIGNRDGLPATARDQANRIALTRYLADYTARGPLSAQERSKLDGFRAIRDRLAQSPADPPVLLYGLSDQGQGRGILSFGNPDTATDIAAYVPGLGTELRNVGGKDADRARNLWSAARAADPARSPAAMVWLGYDPPPGVDRLDPQTLGVLGQARAEAGAASYDRFLAGLRAGHEGPPPHLTALGHSYGSLTVGLAGRRPGGTGADDIVLVGSPGTGAERAAQLGVDPDRVWVGAADNDPVSYLPGPLGELGGDLNQRWFGKDPASAEFGAHRFEVADGPSGSFAAHSDYLDPSGGPSLGTVGAIVTGHRDRVGPQPPR
ncbi:hypothetical protein GCM10009665_46140 [Kitasatospora nipponensis]|uniref:DUF1023 domain-containing protein n=1 Tax=Kitasatospora nipponensis TaxID=258049 RepID=A0ABP4H821_9ACTN